MPAYESDTGALLVMECLVAFFGRGGEPRAPLLMPRSYMTTTLRAPSNLAALHDDPDAIWSWRPLLYVLKITTTERIGSQSELSYRIGIYEAHMWNQELLDKLITLHHECPREEVGPEQWAVLARKVVDDFQATPIDLAYDRANKKADALLREHLSPYQLLELVTGDGFHVRGNINRLYYIDVGNGASIVDPITRLPLVSLCIHPDDWIPPSDVALSLKLMIESGPEGEKELLEGARARVLPPAPKPHHYEREAWRMERDLLPSPRAEVA